MGKWTDDDVDTLDLPELRTLHLSMTKKLFLLEERLDRCIFFSDDEKYAKIMKKQKKKELANS